MRFKNVTCFNLHACKHGPSKGSTPNVPKLKTRVRRVSTICKGVQWLMNTQLLHVSLGTAGHGTAR